MSIFTFTNNFLVIAHYSAVTLSWIYAFFYYNYDVSNQILDLEVESSPNSALILFTSGYVLRKQGKVQEATEQFQKAKSGMSAIPEFQLKIDYEMGTNNFLLLKWADAVVLLTHFLENTKAEAFRAYCAYQIAFCHIMLGDNDKAAVFMKKIKSWVRKVSD